MVAPGFDLGRLIPRTFKLSSQFEGPGIWPHIFLLFTPKYSQILYICFYHLQIRIFHINLQFPKLKTWKILVTSGSQLKALFQPPHRPSECSSLTPHIGSELINPCFWAEPQVRGPGGLELTAFRQGRIRKCHWVRLLGWGFPDICRVWGARRETDISGTSEYMSNVQMSWRAHSRWHHWLPQAPKPQIIKVPPKKDHTLPRVDRSSVPL